MPCNSNTCYFNKQTSPVKSIFGTMFVLLNLQMDCASVARAVLHLFSASSIPDAKVVAMKCPGQTVSLFQCVGYHSIKTLALAKRKKTRVWFEVHPTGTNGRSDVGMQVFDLRLLTQDCYFQETILSFHSISNTLKFNTGGQRSMASS